MKILWIILLILLILFIFALFYLSRLKRGCSYPDAINYQANLDLHDPDTCLYKQKGCLDPRFSNYNPYATIACSEDCQKCKPNSTDPDVIDCKYCISTSLTSTSTFLTSTGGTKTHRGIQECSKEEKCIPAIKGCNRPWAINYNKNANVDDKSCITAQVFLNTLKIISSPEEVYIEVDNEVVTKTGGSGINVVLITRDFKIRNYDFFGTDEDQLQSNELWTFFRNNLRLDDIVICANKGPFSTYLMPGVQDIFTDLGARMIRTLSNDANYIFIGTKKRDIYYEEQSKSNIFFPKTILSYKGCFKSLDKKEKEEINMNPPKDPKYCSFIGENKFLFNGSECIQFNNISKLYPSNSLNCSASDDLKLYEIKKKIVNTYDLYNNDNDLVVIFPETKLRGSKVILDVGYYTHPFIGTSLTSTEGTSTKQGGIKTIKSILVPTNFLVTMHDEDGLMLQILGPTNVYDIDIYKIDAKVAKFKKPESIKIEYIEDQILLETKEGFRTYVTYGKKETPYKLIIKKIKNIPPSTEILLYDYKPLTLDREKTQTQDDENYVNEEPNHIYTITNNSKTNTLNIDDTEITKGATIVFVNKILS